MVVLTATVVTAIVATGGAASPAVLGAVAEGIGAGASGAAAATAGGATTGAAVAAATTTAAASGAVTGAVVTGTGTGVAVGATVGGATAAGVSSVGAGAGTAVTAAALGPLGWAILGAEYDPSNNYGVTFDCWKSVVQDYSKEPSKGRLLKDVLSDSRIKGVQVFSDPGKRFPEIMVENVWEEKYQIDFVTLPWNEVAAHATRIQ